MRKYLLCILLFSFCEKNPKTEFESFYVVFGVISPEAAEQRVVFDSSYSITEEVTDTTGIEGAEVIFISENDTIYLSEKEKGVYVTEQSIKHGKEYQLEIFHNGSFIVSEKTKVPERIKIKSPLWGDTVIFEKGELLIWNRAEGCYKNTYVVWSKIAGDGDEPSGTLISPVLASLDTFSNIFNHASMFPVLDTFYFVYVEGYDENGYRWLRGEYELFDRENVKGAFFSFSKDSVLVYIKGGEG